MVKAITVTSAVRLCVDLAAKPITPPLSTPSTLADNPTPKTMLGFAV